MVIESVRLNHYRNYESLDLVLDPGTNLFYGDNAQGKTNILEAVYVCGTTHSHRAGKDRELIQFSFPEAHIQMMVNRAGIPCRVDMHLRKDRAKGIAINGTPVRRARELLGIVNLVFFSPEDLNIIKEGPALRRRFIDSELCQLDKIYLSDLTDYTRIVGQRNRLLKEIYLSSSLQSTLDVWDEQLVTYGKKIIEKRTVFLEEINRIIRDIHKDISGGREDIFIEYEPECQEDQLEEQVFLARERDLRLKTSTIGPHRDDMKVIVNGIDIRRFGSQGQHRSAALSLKLSEIYLVKSKIHESPVLLLDDVLSELDSTRQNCLLDRIHDIQTLVTCTGLDDFVSHQFNIDKLFHVVNGKIL